MGIVISVSDGTESASLSAFNLEVESTNTPPTITGTPNTTSSGRYESYSFTPTGEDEDDGDILTYAINNKPTWATFSTATGTLTGTPMNSDVGTTMGIVISVSDGTESASLSAFNLGSSIGTNTPPTITGTPNTTSSGRYESYSFTPTGEDEDDGDILTYAINNKPTWATFSTATGALTGTPASSDVGTTMGIVISVSDGTESASLSAFNLEVESTNTPPTITGTPNTGVVVGTEYSFSPTGEDVDVGDILTYEINNKPTWATFSTATGTLTGTPMNSDVGTTMGIVITVSDRIESASLSAFDLEVEGRLLANESFEVAGISISPNPTGGILNVKNISEKTDYILLNIRGKILKKGAFVIGDNKINLSSLAKGVYFLNLKTTTKGSVTKRIVKN